MRAHYAITNKYDEILTAVYLRSEILKKGKNLNMEFGINGDAELFMAA